MTSPLQGGDQQFEPAQAQTQLKGVRMALTASSYKVLQKESKAPEFSLPAIDGKNYSLKDFKGKKVILIIFMCNHCPFVQAKIEKLNELHEKYASKGLAIIGINVNDAERYPDDSFEKMKEFARERKIKFTYLYDESQKTAKEYGATCTPDPFLFDSEFKLAYHGRIDDAHGKEHKQAKTNELEEAIIELLEKGRVEKTKSMPSLGCSIKWKERF